MDIIDNLAVETASTETNSADADQKIKEYLSRIW